MCRTCDFTVHADLSRTQTNSQFVMCTVCITIPSWPPMPTCSDAQEEYNEEDIQALVHMHVMSEEEEEEDYCCAVAN